MACNFHGVHANFVTFVDDLDPIKTKGAWPKASLKLGQLFSVVITTVIQLMMSLTIIILLARAICLQKWLCDKTRNHVSTTSSLAQRHTPGLG